MIISNLDHLEVVSEASSIVGGSYCYCKPYKKVIKVIVVKPVEKPKEEAEAKAYADAAAFGKSTFTETNTATLAIAGVSSFSKSSSVASAKN